MTKVIIKTNGELIRLISKLKDTVEIHCSTFNISAWENHGPAHSILHQLNQRKSHLIVGVPFFRSCTGDYGRGRCRSCLEKHNKVLINLASYRDRYANIDWKFVNNLHAKFIVAGDLTVTGGRNISDGDLADLSFAEIDRGLSEQLIKIWQEYSANSYDIGTKGPLVFTTPYKGEIMADSKAITEEYKQEVLRTMPNSTEGRFWSK